MQNKKYSENLVILLLSGFFFFHIVEFMIMMPLGPQLMRVLNIDAAQFSHLVAIYNFAAAISGIVGILWMDKWDRKTLLIIVNILFAIGTTLCFLSSSYLGLLSARVMTGAFGGVVGALCMTIVGDIVPFERRGFAMSKLMSAFSIAAIVGIPLGLSLAHHFSWQAPFIFVAAGTSLFCVISYFKLPSLTGHIHGHARTTLRDVTEIFADPDHIKCFIFMALLMFGQFTVIPFISPSLVRNTGMTEAQLPLVYLFGGAVTALTNPVIGRLSDIYSKPLMFRISAVLAFIPILLVTNQGLSPLYFTLIVTTMFFVFSSGRMSPAMALITAVVRPEKRGRFMSLNSAVQQGSAGLAAWLAGIVVTSNATGHLDGYPWVGYIAVVSGMLSLYWVSKIHILSKGTTAVKEPGVKFE